MVDLQVFAIPRITLKPLVSSFPCFANIQVSLMEKVCGNVKSYFWLIILTNKMFLFFL